LISKEPVDSFFLPKLTVGGFYFLLTDAWRAVNPCLLWDEVCGMFFFLKGEAIAFLLRLGTSIS